MNEEKNENLFKRLIARFHHNKIVQKLTSLVIASSLVLTLGACDETNTQDNINNTNDPNNNTSNVGNENNNTNNNQNNENNNQSNIDISQYSQLLQNVLNNDHYDELLNSVIAGEHGLLETGEFEPHPYAFLESEGFNVESIKAGNDLAYTMSYVIEDEPNILYMHTRVLVDNFYWTNYLLKYTLTDEEMEDYRLMMSGYGNISYYMQSIFINNELSKMKTPEIIGKSNVSVASSKNLTESVGKQNLVDSNKCLIILTNFDTTNKTFYLHIIPQFYNNNIMVFESNIKSLKTLADFKFTNGAYTSPNNFGALTPYKNNDFNATIYLPQDAVLTQTNYKNFETTTRPNK